MKSLLKVQVISRDLPLEGSGGSSTYRISLLQYLKRVGCQIQYLLLEYKQPRSVVNLEGSPQFDGLMSVKKLILQNLDAAPIWSALPIPEEINFVQENAQGFKPDLMIADHPWLGGIFTSTSEYTNVVKAILTHDVQHKKIQEFKRLGLNPYKRNYGFELPYWDEQLECQCLSRADIVLAIQKEDYQYFKQKLPNTEVIYLPMAVPVKDNNQRKQIPGRCLFVGGSAQHNAYSLRWFLNDVWPNIISHYPSASLHVCGDVSKEMNIDMYQKESQIVFRGRVKSLEIEYAEADLCVIPLVVGSGLKIKLIEAMSYGRACVSTRIGVQGIEEVANYGVTVADRSNDFATAVVSLLSDSSKRKILEKLNIQFIKNYLYPDIVYGDFVRRIYVIAHK